MAAEETWTIGRLLEWTTGFFRGKGLEEPRLDAEMLLAHVLACPRIQLYALFDADVLPADRTRYRDLVKARAARRPVAYLVGEREFYGLPFHVGPAALVPRPETELVVGEALAFLKGRSAPRFLDLGTGSGAIAVTIAKKNTEAIGVAADQSADALDLARRNAARHGVAERLEFRRGDWTAGLEGPFDLIVSNPPYIATAEIDTLAPEVRDCEPRLALDGGADGLACYRLLAAGAMSVAAPGARLLLEIGAGQETAVRGLLADAGWTLLPTTTDYARIPRVVAAERPAA